MTHSIQHTHRVPSRNVCQPQKREKCRETEEHHQYDDNFELFPAAIQQLVI